MEQVVSQNSLLEDGLTTVTEHLLGLLFGMEFTGLHSCVMTDHIQGVVHLSLSVPMIQLVLLLDNVRFCVGLHLSYAERSMITGLLNRRKRGVAP